MKQLMNAVKVDGDHLEKKAVLRLELDYELATLFDAMKEENEELKEATKAKLQHLRQELLQLKAL